MENKKFRIYWILSVIGVLAASYYPLYMGVRVIVDMIKDGTVQKENYPKYIIPYTPVAFAVILSVLLLPLLIKVFRRFAVLAASALSVCTFFGVELLFERNVVVSALEETGLIETGIKLEAWQMYMCAIDQRDGYLLKPVMEHKEYSAVEILMGEYNPAFKLHFYLISVVLILAILNSIYGFAQMIKTGDKSRAKALIMQSGCAAVFLGLCILACFTAFWRDGSLIVSPLSASLMAAFFILLGLTVGVFVGSLMLKSKKAVLYTVPAASALIVTLVMYIGEMILLHGNLYRFGEGFFFDGLPGIVLAPVDILVILLSGVFTWLCMLLAVRDKKKPLTTGGNNE
ncbi:MAG: hypothetical protein IKH51_11280 [Clostridia bacterium]|nr:hypothetical protein [Clostridia bacterium]